MANLSKGSKVPVAEPGTPGTFTISVSSSQPVDVFAMLGEEKGQDRPQVLHPDNALVFYGQPEFRTLRQTANNPTQNVFTVDASELTDNRYVSITVAVDQNEFPQTSLDDVADLKVSLTSPSGETFDYSPAAGTWGRNVTAGVLVDLYNKSQSNKVRFGAVGQGWDAKGGVAELLRQHGADIVEEPTPPTPQETTVETADRDLAGSPRLLSLMKKADISLKKLNLANHKARVALIVDTTDFMIDLYETGAVQALAERLAAVARRLDDNGELDLFSFNHGGGYIGSASIDKLPRFDRSFGNLPVLEPSLPGEAGVLSVARHYYGNASQSRNEAQPVFLLFLSNERFIDPARSRAVLSQLSPMAMFTQFVGAGTGGFEKMRELSDMSGRTVDNAGFVTFPSLEDVDDGAFLDGILNEYPSWVRDAQRHQIVARNVGIEFGM